jgi:hypothetical protein
MEVTDFGAGVAIIASVSSPCSDATGHGQNPITGPPVSVWALMQQLWPSALTWTHGDTAAAETPLR